MKLNGRISLFPPEDKLGSFKDSHFCNIIHTGIGKFRVFQKKGNRPIESIIFERGKAKTES